MTNITDITLGALLSSSNEIIKRNAMSILKQIQKGTTKEKMPCTQCGNPDAVVTHYKAGGCTSLVAEDCNECGYEWRRDITVP